MAFIHYVIFLCLVAGAKSQATCEGSYLGYDCMKVLADFYILHWTLEGDFLQIAAEGFGAEWVGFSFAEREGLMAPADAVIGWIDVNGVSIEPYRLETNSVFNQDKDPSITLKDISAVQDGDLTTIFFTRLIREGQVDINPQEETMINFAIGDTDSLKYHSDNRGWSSVTFAAIPISTSTVIKEIGKEEPSEEKADLTETTPAPAPSSESLASSVEPAPASEAAASSIDQDEFIEDYLDSLSPL